MELILRNTNNLRDDSNAQALLALAGTRPKETGNETDNSTGNDNAC